MEIAIKRLNDEAKIPTRGSDEAAGYDLYANLGANRIFSIPAHRTVKIGTGVAMAIPKNCFGAIFARSGIAVQRGLRPANAVGVIDSDYRGEIIVALHNDSNEEQIIENNERIAQIVILPYVQAEFTVVDDLDDTERGSGGFGSTDDVHKQMTINEYLDSLTEQARSKN